jgi:cation diffusion facilitator family transporter
LLCIIKITVGAVAGSISIIADGFNNLSDMGSSVITMIGFKLANKPADSDHPFGHGRIEYVSAFIVSALILLVGFELLKSSANALINNEAAPTYSLIAIIILAVEEYLWFVSLIVLGSAGIILICAFFSVAMILGFADIVENTAKMAGEKAAFVADESEELPEL